MSCGFAAGPGNYLARHCRRTRLRSCNIIVQISYCKTLNDARQDSVTSFKEKVSGQTKDSAKNILNTHDLTQLFS